MTGDLVETRVTTRRYAAIFFLDNLTDMIMTGMFKIRVKARDIQNPGYRREGCWMPWPEGNTRASCFRWAWVRPFSASDYLERFYF